MAKQDQIIIRTTTDRKELVKQAAEMEMRSMSSYIDYLIEKDLREKKLK